MLIKQKKAFQPLTITLETEKEYKAFVRIIDEADAVTTSDKVFMDKDAISLALDLAAYFSEN